MDTGSSPFKVAKQALSQPLFWIICTFLAAFFVFFVYPIFLNPQREMLFPQYVSIITPIAEDFRYLIQFCTTWAIEHRSPYDGIRFYHPPLTLVIFTPLIFLKFSQAFFLMTVITFVCFTGSALVLPALQQKPQRLTPLIMLLFVAGLSSFGFQFELERGQFYSFVLFLCYLSIFLFHTYPRLRYVAYALFSISIQVKFFPALLAVMFIRDWLDWKNNLRRVLGLGAVNFALLFVMGPDIFWQFVNVVIYQSREPYVWTANHSVTSFVTLLAGQGTWLRANLWAGQVPLILLYLTCFGLTLWQVYRRRTDNPNPYLLVVCVIGGLVIPAVSHDYSLPILAGPMALFLGTASEMSASGWKRILVLALITLASFAYFTTLFSDAYKPFLPTLLMDNFPALLVILGCAVALLCLSNQKRGQDA